MLGILLKNFKPTQIHATLTQFLRVLTLKW